MYDKRENWVKNIGGETLICTKSLNQDSTSAKYITEWYSPLVQLTLYLIVLKMLLIFSITYCAFHNSFFSFNSVNFSVHDIFETVSSRPGLIYRIPVSYKSKRILGWRTYRKSQLTSYPYSYGAFSFHSCKWELLMVLNLTCIWKPIFSKRRG